MSALLKAGDPIAQATVRALEPPACEGALVFEPASAFAGPPMPDAPILDPRAELEAVIADLHKRLAQAEDAADTREDAAFERGRREAQDLVTGESEKRLELLREGIAALRQAHGERLAEYELLALQLARTALQRVFGNADVGTDLVQRAIAQALAATKRELVLNLRVSPRDFRSEDDLRPLAEQFPGIAIVRDETLPAGGCVVGQRLGSIDLSLPGQWERLSAFFEGLADEAVET